MLTKQFFREIGKIGGKKGGQAKVKKGFAWLTPKEARENARRAAILRWTKAKKEAK